MHYKKVLFFLQKMYTYCVKGEAKPDSTAFVLRTSAHHCSQGFSIIGNDGGISYGIKKDICFYCICLNNISMPEYIEPADKAGNAVLFETFNGAKEWKQIAATGMTDEFFGTFRSTVFNVTARLCLLNLSIRSLIFADWYKGFGYQKEGTGKRV